MMLVVPWPAPWMVIAFVTWTPFAPQVKFPAGIVIVSPSAPVCCESAARLLLIRQNGNRGPAARSEKAIYNQGKRNCPDCFHNCRFHLCRSH